MKSSLMQCCEVRWVGWPSGEWVRQLCWFNPSLTPEWWGRGVRGTLRAAHSNPRALFLQADRAVISLYGSISWLKELVSHDAGARDV